MKQFIYLAYYLKNLNRNLFSKFLEFAHFSTGRSKFLLSLDCVFCTLKYKISLLEYFQFRFYELTTIERRKWAGTGYMYEYQRIMNPVDKREILNDKILFCKSYSQFIKRNVFDINDLQSSKQNILKILSNPIGKIVFKAKSGNCGKQVEIRNTADFSPDNLVGYMSNHNFDMVEDFIVQHNLLTELSPNSVNTVRVFTNLTKEDFVDILGCRLRLGIEKNVDNLASGGIAVAVDEETGIVTSAGVYSDITKKPESIHPVSGKNIVGFQIPFWNETMKMVKEAALLYPQNRSIGWDIAITELGPELIEGNHDWCKLVYQLPVGEGLKNVLENYRLGKV